ncbi:mRNA-capping enzyme subunit beta [Malassezia pachydermatis]|uniref:mRNA-capping enzyme subunit beta n=1 Tax=Malassezia pachydermatis TaxID=77020 RepID=A0A0M9VPK9_9BASI|nr:mrna triphosphatase cet1 [Malassezia pachydermatis]KOS14569.1 mrna triphosphatase cet1 [Malassezia pachydermatis]
MTENGLPPMRSLFGADPLDEFATFVADWLWQNMQGRANIEIEAKLGLLIDRQTNMRLQLPVYNETIIDARALGVRFESNMSMKQHASFNKLLNELVAYSTTLPEHERITYKHQKETDFFYDVQMQDTGETVHLRVTRDSKTQSVKPNGVVTKQRIADLNVFCPARAYDYRISINTETPMPPPPDTCEPTYSREKDRLSYAHQNYQVDLTQVLLPNKPHEPNHELELEIRDATYFMQLAQDTRLRNPEMTQEWSPYEDQVVVFLNNIRLLIRNADTFMA